MSCLGGWPRRLERECGRDLKVTGEVPEHGRRHQAVVVEKTSAATQEAKLNSEAETMLGSPMLEYDPALIVIERPVHGEGVDISRRR